MVESMRMNNISDTRIINVLDLGAGPSMKKKSLRKVSDIAKYSAVPLKYGILLSNLAAEFGKPLRNPLVAGHSVKTAIKTL